MNTLYHMFRPQYFTFSSAKHHHTVYPRRFPLFYCQKRWASFFRSTRQKKNSVHFVQNRVLHQALYEMEKVVSIILYQKVPSKRISYDIPSFRSHCNQFLYIIHARTSHLLWLVNMKLQFSHLSIRGLANRQLRSMKALAMNLARSVSSQSCWHRTLLRCRKCSRKAMN